MLVFDDNIPSIAPPLNHPNLLKKCQNYTPHFLLPTAYCLLLTAYCLLPTAYCSCIIHNISVDLFHNRYTSE